MSEPNKIRKWVVEKFDGISPGLMANSNPPKEVMSISKSALGLFERCDSFFKKGAT